MYLVFDTETDGLIQFKKPNSDPSQPHICQLAAKLVTPDFQEVAYINTLIKPNGWRIPPEGVCRPDGSRVHFIDHEQCERDGWPIDDVIELLDLLADHSTHLVAHNIAFDYRLVMIEAGRSYVVDPTILAVSELPQVCTMKTLTPILKLPGNYGHKWPTLTECHECFFGEGFEDAHEAMTDVDVCIRVLRHMLENDMLEL